MPSHYQYNISLYFVCQIVGHKITNLHNCQIRKRFLSLNEISPVIDNMRGILQYLTQLRGVLIDVTDKLTVSDETNIIVPPPRAVALLSSIGSTPEESDADVGPTT